MLQAEPVKTYRLTWDELMARRSEIAPDAVLEIKVYEPEVKPQVSAKNAAIAYLKQRIAEDATDNPKEIRQADAEVQELMENLSRNRIEAGERPLLP
jgi:hypothetical protein